MATKKKRSTLPKDFEDLLKSGADLQALQRVFDSCEIDARGGYSQETALLMPNCPDMLARWLVEQGADLKAVDRYGKSALHIAAGTRRDISLLLELGCDVKAITPSGDTPLHTAADAKNLTTVERLLAAGAEVNATNREGLTPLEQGLWGCTNIEIERIVSIAHTLLKAGTRRTTRMNEFVLKIGENFEFHRAAFAKNSVEATSEALIALCQIFGVQPPPRRVMHDGKSEITVRPGRWQQQHGELWELLVPSKGPAATVQGEVIRISGRIGDEISRNGGGNWDADYTKMSRTLIEFIRGGKPLVENDIRKAEEIVEEIVAKRGGGDHDHSRLAEFAVEWVRQNPQSQRLGNVAYKR